MTDTPERFSLSADGDLIDQFTGEGIGGSDSYGKMPFTIDRRSCAPMTHEEARALADRFGATVFYKLPAAP